MKPTLFQQSTPLLAAAILSAIVGLNWPQAESAWAVAFGVFMGSLLLCTICQYTGFKAAGRILATAQHAIISQHMKELADYNKEAAASITKAENNLVDELTKIGIAFDALGETHPSEQHDFGIAIRHAQAIILSRTGLRSASMFDRNPDNLPSTIAQLSEHRHG